MHGRGITYASCTNDRNILVGMCIEIAVLAAAGGSYGSSRALVFVAHWGYHSLVWDLLRPDRDLSSHVSRVLA